MTPPQEGPASPPRLARAILRYVAPPDDREFIVGDLDEEFGERVSTTGRERAGRWYALQVALSLAPLTRQRLTQRPLHPRQRATTMTGLSIDLSDALRRARRTPFSTSAIVLISALGIGASTAVYTVVHALLLAPLPFAGSERVVRLESVVPALATSASYLPSDNWLDFVTWRESAKSYEALAGIWEGGPSRVFKLADQTAAFPVAVVTERFDDVLGVRALIGRSFAPGEFADAGPRAIALTEHFWRTRFGGDSSVVGRAIEVSDTMRVIVGVLADANDYPGPVAAWIPVAPAPGRPMAGRGMSWIALFGRLRRGVTPDQARAELQSLIARTSETAQQKTRLARVIPLTEILTGPVRPVLLLLAAVVAVTLLVAAVNVALLLLTQAEARARELAIRLALGSGLTRLARKLAVESLLLAAVGGALGIGLARVLVSRMVAFYPGRLVRAEEVTIGAPVIAVALCVTIVVGLVGAWPLLRRLRRADLVVGLREGGVGGSPRAVRVRQLMAVCQLAFAAALVVSGALLARAFDHLQRIDPGFRARGVAYINVSMSVAHAPDATARLAHLDNAETVVRGLPGVTATASVNYLPLPSRIVGWGTHMRRADDAENREYEIQFRQMSPEYLGVMGIPLRDGRNLRASDDAAAPLVALINETLAKAAFPSEHAIGRDIVVQSRTYTVVGVVGDVRYWGLAKPVVGEVFVTATPASALAFRSVVFKTNNDAGVVIAAIRAALRAADPEIVVSSSGTLTERLAAASAPERFRALLVGALAVIALLLAGLGLFAVSAHAVATRTRDIGIRVALGATRGRVRARVVRDALALTGLGLVCGLGLAWATARGLRGFLADAPGLDAGICSLVGVVFLLVSVVAALGPAVRASRVDPVIAMRGGA